MNNNFKFHLPLEVLEKAYDKNGNEVMKIGGIASTSEKDTDGEFLDPTGFDLSYFTNQGFFNYHHMAKNNPNAIVGEPTKAEIRKEGLYVEGFLYPDSELAKSIYSTAKMLENNSSNRRLGFSIEGVATKRKNEKKEHPDFKHIQKANITGCAITFMPKNPKTFLDLIKGGIDEDYEEDEEDDEEIKKMLSAGSETGTDVTNKENASGAPLKLESLGKDKKSLKNVTTAQDVTKEEKDDDEKEEILSKSQVVSYIFDKYTDINFNIAEKVCNFILKGMKSNKSEVTGTELEKALDSIEKGFTPFKKEEEGESKEEKEEEDEKDELKKGKNKSKKSEKMEKAVEAKEEKEEKLEGKEEEEEVEKANVEGVMSQINSEIKKGIDSVLEMINDKNYSVGVILKGIYDTQLSLNSRIEAIEKGVSTDINKAVEGGALESTVSTDLSKAIEIFSGVSAQLETLSSRMEGMEKALDMPQPRKSITSRPVERRFSGDEEIEKGQKSDGKMISASNKAAVLDALDKATFEKGFDADFADAMTKFESNVNLSPRIISRLQVEKGITIV